MLGVKNLGLDLGFGLGLGLGSFALISRERAGNILPLVVSLPCALRTVNSVSSCIIYRACVHYAVRTDIALYTALFTVRAHGEYHQKIAWSRSNCHSPGR